MPALAVRKLAFRWPRSHFALKVPELEVAAREHVFLHGCSGSGKSTLLSLIAGTLRPDAGGIAIGGAPMNTLGASARDRLRADRIGVLFQQFNLLPFLTPMETCCCHVASRRSGGSVPSSVSDRCNKPPIRCLSGLDWAMQACVPRVRHHFLSGSNSVWRRRGQSLAGQGW